MVGDQTLVHDCSKKDAITFQFGYLTAEQKKEIPEYRSFLSLAVRTDYDLKTLRSKGFIYFAPESGPDKPDVNYIVNKPWTHCDGCILLRAITHELGHFYGFAHGGQKHQLMHEYHLEWYATPESWGPGNQTYFPFPLTLASSSFSSNMCFHQVPEFWGVGSEGGCIHIDEASNSEAIKVWWSKDAWSEKKLLGEILADRNRYLEEVSVYLRLPTEQMVFPQEKRSLLRAFKGRSRREISASFVSIAKPNVKNGVLLQLQPDRLLNIKGFGPQGVPLLIYGLD